MPKKTAESKSGKVPDPDKDKKSEELVIPEEWLAQEDPADKKQEEKKESRRAHRSKIVKFIWYKILEELPDSTGDEGIAYSCDLSRTGVGIYISRSLPINKKIFLEISLGDQTLSGVGLIAYSKMGAEGKYRIGVRFLVLPPNDRILLKKVLL